MANETTVVSGAQRLLALMDDDGVLPAGKAPERVLPPVSQSDAEAQAEAAEEAKVAKPETPKAEAPTVPDDLPTPALRRLKVKVDGEEQELPEDEVVRGYQRMGDYTKKTMQVAEERKVALQAAAEAKQAREAFKAKVIAMEEALALVKPEEPDWAKLRAENPTEFTLKWAEHQQFQEARDRLHAERATMAQQEAEELVQQRRQFVTEQQQRLLDALPEWRDPVVKQQEDVALMQYGRTQGFADQELASVVDYRAVVILRKAMLYDQLQAKKAALPAPTGTSPTLTPAAAAPPATPEGKKAYQEARAKLRQTGHPRDATAAILAALDAGRG